MNVYCFFLFKHYTIATDNMIVRHTTNPHAVEIGVDEVGRGPLFGRVYAAAVVLPPVDPDSSFDPYRLRDSKKYHSKKKLEEAATSIRTHAVAWAVEWASEGTIDEVNILQASQLAMHAAIRNVRAQVANAPISLLIDGNYFRALDPEEDVSEIHLIKGGDGTHSAIAAASILAKVARDAYIHQLCIDQPELDERYGIAKNHGYPAPSHLAGLKQWGAIEGHRRTFRPVREAITSKRKYLNMICYNDVSSDLIARYLCL